MPKLITKEDLEFKKNIKKVNKFVFNKYNALSKHLIALRPSMEKIPVRQIKVENELYLEGRFSIRKVSDLLQGKDLSHHLHRHDFYFILVLYDGAGVHEIDFKKYPIQDNSIFILKPGQVHQLELKNNSFGYLIEFDNTFYHPTGKLANQRFLKAINNDSYVFESKQIDKILQILKLVFEEYLAKEDAYNEAIKASLDLLFIELNRNDTDKENLQNSVSSYVQERFDEFKDLLDRNIRLNRQTAYYAGLLNLSVYQLNSITKTAVNKSVSELINEQILLEAKRYLLATSNQIKDIADDLGFDDISYFIRFFKKHTGITPEAFRRNF